MAAYCVKWRVGTAEFELSIDPEHPDVMTLARGNSLPHFFTRAEAYAFAKQIAKNFSEVGRGGVIAAQTRNSPRKNNP